MKPRLVMKFGGTSVGSPEALALVVAHVARCPSPPMVVASAVGGVTDLLLAAARLAREGADYGKAHRDIVRRHQVIIEHFGLDAALLDAEDQELTRLLQGISMLRELSPRISDQLVSLGERASVRLLAAVLSRRGVPAAAHNSYDLGLCTNADHGRAEPLPESSQAIARCVAELPDGVVPVITGFIARGEHGAITTLGRGGSDFSAAIFGAACQVQEIQIWTDVPGILRADPRVVPEAQVVPAMRFDEGAELAFFGAKVLHPRTIEPARKAGIPVRVLSTLHVDPSDPRPVSAHGTLLDDTTATEPIRALALHKDVQSLHIHSLRMLEAPGFLARVFDVLARHRISVDVVATSEVSVSLTLDRHEGEISRAVTEIGTFAEVELIPERSLICLVGAGLRKDSGLHAQVFNVLAAHQIPVRMISQGASRINITIVTDPPFAEPAMKALHQHFFG